MDWDKTKYFSHDFHCGAPPFVPVGTDGYGCSCRIAHDFRAMRRGTYQKPFDIGLIYPKVTLIYNK